MNKLSYFKIGLFVIAASVIAIVGVLLLGVGSAFKKNTLVETYLEESVQGLDVGSPVKFRGVPIGTVEKISLSNAEYPTRKRYVLVRVGIEPSMFQVILSEPGQAGFQHEIDRGLRLRLAPQGFTGVAYLEADYADPQRNPPLAIDWQPRYPYVPSTRSRITQLSDALEKILRGLESVDLGRLVDGMEKSLSMITKVAEGANLDKLATQGSALFAEIRDTNRQIKALLGSDDVKLALKDGAAAAKTARVIVERAEKPLQQLMTDLPQATDAMNRMTKRLDAVAKDLPESSAQLLQTIQRVNRMVASQQRDIERTMENLRTISDNLKEITENSKKYPSQVLFGAPPPPSKVMPR